MKFPSVAFFLALSSTRTLGAPTTTTKGIRGMQQQETQTSANNVTEAAEYGTLHSDLMSVDWETVFTNMEKVWPYSVERDYFCQGLANGNGYDDARFYIAYYQMSETPLMGTKYEHDQDFVHDWMNLDAYAYTFHFYNVNDPLRKFKYIETHGQDLPDGYYAPGVNMVHLGGQDYENKIHGSHNHGNGGPLTNAPVLDAFAGSGQPLGTFMEVQDAEQGEIHVSPMSQWQQPQLLVGGPCVSPDQEGQPCSQFHYEVGGGGDEQKNLEEKEHQYYMDMDDNTVGEFIEVYGNLHTVFSLEVTAGNGGPRGPLFRVDWNSFLSKHNLTPLCNGYNF